MCGNPDGPDGPRYPVEWILCELKATTALHENQHTAADVILGMAQALPRKKLEILEVIIARPDYLDYNIEGIVIGMFEMDNVGESSFKFDEMLFSALAIGGVVSRLLDSKSTNEMRSRLSAALHKFITPAWKNGSHLKYRLALISALQIRLTYLLQLGNCQEPPEHPHFLREPGYNIPEPTVPPSCMELLCDEMSKRFLMASGLSYRMRIIGGEQVEIEGEHKAATERFRRQMLEYSK